MTVSPWTWVCDISRDYRERRAGKGRNEKMCRNGDAGPRKEERRRNGEKERKENGKAESVKGK